MSESSTDDSRDGEPQKQVGIAAFGISKADRYGNGARPYGPYGRVWAHTPYGLLGPIRADTAIPYGTVIKPYGRHMPVAADTRP
jgi:hypothetical protein